MPRPRLVQTLSHGLARGRVLICAPAGFGKTSLLADWARSGGRPVAWLGLDAGDNDPARFWRYLVAALDQAQPGIAERLGPLLGPPAPRSSDGLVTALINELAAQPDREEVLLVLDDYHLVDAGPVHESVAFLLVNLPPGLLLVVSGRADPPLPLARLRARGQLAELPLALAGFFQARLDEDADGALAKLDQAAATDLGLPQYFRGLALAGLPPDRGRAEQAVADLEFVLAVRDQFPPMLLRAAHYGLAAAHAVLGHDEQAAEAMRKSGLGTAPAGTQLMFGGFWATARDGFRFTSPRILRPEPGIQVAQGYDFSDLALITTSDGVVAIDAGTTEDRVKAALGDLDLPADGAISHLILTHAHWDHIGGAGALRGPGTRVIAQAGFPAGLDRKQGERPGFRYFTGAAGSLPPAVVPDQLISQPTPLTAGGTELVLYPTPGGETADALMVHLPASGVLFAGDVLMPYLGQPFAAEGSPEGLLEALAFIGSLRPRLLIHGHATLTEQFTAEVVPGLQTALTQLHGEVLDGIRGGRALPDILDQASLPAVLRDHPTALADELRVKGTQVPLGPGHTAVSEPSGTRPGSACSKKRRR